MKSQPLEGHNPFHILVPLQHGLQHKPLTYHNCAGDHRCPKTVFVATCGLGGAPADELALAHLIDHFSFVPIFVRVKLDPQCRGQHGCSKILCKIRSLFVCLAKTVVFADVTVLLPVFRSRKAY